MQNFQQNSIRKSLNLITSSKGGFEGLHTMAIEYQIKTTDAYLDVTAKGRGNNLVEVQSYAQAVIQAMQKSKSKCVLCDELELTHELQDIDTYMLGKTVAEYAGHVEKVAIVVSPECVPKESFYELVTNNRGLYLQVFTDLEEARNWLIESKKINAG